MSMKKILSLSSLLIAISIGCKAQQHYHGSLLLPFLKKVSVAQIVKPDIQYITLEDTFLIHVIDSLIKYEIKHDSLFAEGYGYFVLDFSQEIRNGKDLKDNTRIDTVFQYDISTYYMHPNGRENLLGDMYPSHYAFINNRLVCLFMDKLYSYTGYSIGSKQVFERLIEQYMGPPSHISRKFFRFDKTLIYYLQNRFTGEYMKPAVLHIDSVKVTNKR